MQFFASTGIVLFLLAGMFAVGPRRGLIILFTLIPFGMMSAFNLPAVGGTSIIGVDLAVVTLMLLTLTFRNGLNDLLSTVAPGTPGFLLFLFFCYSLVATLFFPRVFEGLEVFSLGRAGNEEGIAVQPLRPGSGNLSQLLRIVLGVIAYAVAAALIRRFRDAKLAFTCLGVVTIVHVVLGIVDILTNAAGFTHLLEPIRTANYALTLGHKMAGLNRMIGGFPEASSYGYLSVGLFGFWLSFWVTGKNHSRASAILLGMIAFALLRGTSSAAYVAAAMLCVVFAFSRFATAGVSEVRLRSATLFVVLIALLPVVVLGLYATYQLVPAFADYVDRSLLTKLTTESGRERMLWNIQALRNTVDTYLLGAGLGSVRASNWLFSVLGSTGVVGTVLALGFLYRLFRAPTEGLDDRSRQVVTALKVGCAGFLMNALVVKSSANLEISFYVLAGLAVGLSATASRRTSANPAAPHALRFTLPEFRDTM